ncbi:cupin domain-containing protein [Nonlabens ponticola]|uniref:Cupin domain-containing protein n=1 Tax=Nonlabens ponticola TaxID=2496866 RepID=A0A3S9MUB0_9FLAO|nr:cupin domain-containing protein [Nonlabens ponticola]AZQ42767.1 cupin domain-containing protein [Nonlabens ponticola]
MDKINISNKFKMFEETWTPKIITELNGQQVKLAKLKGEFVWHNHEHEDELFYVVKGELILRFRESGTNEQTEVILKPGEMIVVPAGVDHKPIAHEECHVMLIEPAGIKHTGDVQHELTKDKLDWI